MGKGQCRTREQDEVSQQNQEQENQVDTELPADKDKPVEELEEDHRDEPTEMQDGGE